MRKLHFFTAMSLIWLFFQSSSLDNNVRQIYLDQYADIAMAEMMRTHIPASIKLAQGILESGWGRTKLASESNNHFGIKCKSYWKGKKYYHVDDDYDANGKLIKSCFRVYDNPDASYRDHSDFLVSNQRYARLFQLHQMDYVGWAIGLKKCGYATNPHYAKRLIKIIEENQLYIYDEMVLNNQKMQEAPIAENEAPIQNNPVVLEDENEADNEDYLDVIEPIIYITQRENLSNSTIISASAISNTPVPLPAAPKLETSTTASVQSLAKPVIAVPSRQQSAGIQHSQALIAPMFDISRYYSTSLMQQSMSASTLNNHRKITKSIPASSSVGRSIYSPTSQETTPEPFGNPNSQITLPIMRKRLQQSSRPLKDGNMKLRG